MSWPRLLPAGDAAVLLELAPVIDEQVNAQVIAVAAAIRAAALPGVRDVVPTFRSVAVYFDPRRTSRETLEPALLASLDERPVAHERAVVDVPVAYGGEDGPDLDAVAAWAGLSSADVVARHAGRTYRVFMTGFVPGFAYLGSIDPAIAMPRKPTPRLRVPAGAVGIAGQQTGIYPSSSPGGWNLIGRTTLPMFDPQRTPAALLRPGDRVRFTPGDAGSAAADSGEAARRDVTSELLGDRFLTVVRPGLLTTIQDLGRWGHQADGVSVSGAIDREAHVRANQLVGNAPEVATLEATIQGPELRLSAATTLAIAGADLGATVDGVDVPLGHPIRGGAGATLRFAGRRSGCRACVAFDGGVAVRPVLGSRSTHAASGIGPFRGRALMSGDVVPLGDAAAEPGHDTGRPAARRAGANRVRVLPGPQLDFFPPSAMEALQRTRFTVSAQSNRMGYRLDGGRLPRLDGREMISDATFTGAVQVPSSGEPILLMADRQTTGGYPQLAIVITADLPVAAQLAPGDTVEFELCSEADARRALDALAEGVA